MKKHLILILLLITFKVVKSQGELNKFFDRADSQATRLDSLKKIYSSSYSDTIINGIKLKQISKYSNYYYGRIEIKDGKVLEDHPPDALTLNDCNPCYLYGYRKNGTLWSEGVMLMDCVYGHYIRYYPNGKVAFTSNAIPDTSGKHCSNTHGESIVYSRYGDKLASEFWNCGRLRSIVPYHVNTSGDVKFVIEGKVLLINDTIKIGDLEKITMHPDSFQNAELSKGYNVSVQVYQNEKRASWGWDENEQGFKDGKLMARLRENQLDLKQEMQMKVNIMWKVGNEFIETHYLTIRN